MISMVVPDSSPLVVIGKLERVDLLAQLYGDVLLTPAVWEEAVAQGKARGARDAAYLEKASQEFRFRRVKLTEREEQLLKEIHGESGIGLGEAEVLTIAKHRKGLAILDDKGAVALGVAHVGTAGVLLEAFLRKLVTYQALIELVQEFGEMAWISPHLLAAMIRKAGESENR